VGAALVWNNNRLRVLIAVLLAASPAICFAASSDLLPHLLLTPQRLRRLQRDRERETIRWMNFETRIQSTHDSSERGFELGLYYAVTHDEKRGREAVQWALQNRCSRRQVALIIDWAGSLASREEIGQLGNANCPPYPASQPEGLRDTFFMGVALNRITALDDSAKTIFLKWIESGGFQNANQLYAACEFLDGVRATLHAELRHDARQFFSDLPEEFLLGLKPEAVEHPDWMTHIAALALVSLDPNLPGSQYLQGWAIEDRQTIREGPGVAYELLWGDPYLPGVGYQNLDPWVYDEAGRLFARTDWKPTACWIAITRSGLDQENCPAGWRQNPATFGHMTLIPLTQPCTIVPPRNNNEAAIMWNVHPHQSISYLDKKRKEAAEADAAGMWRLPGNVEGKVCATQ